MQMQPGEYREKYLRKALRYCRNQYTKLKQEDPWCHCSHNAVAAMKLTEKRFDLGTFGIEGFCDEMGRDGVTYLNTSDTYKITLCFRNNTERFYISSWGDMLETMERQGFTCQ